MSNFDMPTKRTFAPSPQGLAKFVIRSAVLLFCAAILLVSAKFLWSYAFKPAEVQAATTSPPSRAQSVTAVRAAPVETQPKTDVVEEAAALQERLAVSICEGYGLIFDGPDRGCVRPPPPKAYSAEGIRERGAQGRPLPEAAEFVKKFAAGLIGTREQAQEDEPAPPPSRPAPRARVASSDSESWRPQLRLQGFLHAPGEPCPGGGHRDEAGLMCKFTDEERAELRERRRY